MTMGGKCSLSKKECEAHSECQWVYNVGGHRFECDTYGRMSDETIPSPYSLLERLLDTEVLKAVSQNKWTMDDNQVE